MVEPPRRVRRRALCLGVPVAALVFSGCNREDTLTATTRATVTSSAAPVTEPSTVTTAPPTTLAPATVATAPTTPTPTTPTPTTTPAPDAHAVLAGALDALTAGYHFATTVSVGDQVAVSTVGDHVAGSTRLVTTAGGTSLEYVVAPGQAWVLENGAWRALDGTQALSDPISLLRAPTAVELIGQDGDAATVVAHYPAAALGLPGEADTLVTFALAAGRITSLGYRGVTTVTAADGTASSQPATVTTVITPLAEGAQVTVPPA